MHKNVIGTHHIGASTEQAQNAIAEEVIRILEQYEKGNILNPVNIQIKPKSRYILVTRMYDTIGALDSVLRIIKKNGINVVKLDSMSFIGDKAQYLSIYLDKSPEPEILEQISKQDCIINVELKTVKFPK